MIHIEYFNKQGYKVINSFKRNQSNKLKEIEARLCVPLLRVTV